MSPVSAASGSAGDRAPGERAGGIVLHVTSLPGRGGIGELGAGARRFVDFLAGCGLRLWQVLPLGPTSLEGWSSPYHASSAFAGDPLLLSLEALVDEGLLERGVLDDAPALPAGHVKFSEVVPFKEAALARASAAFRARASPEQRAAFARFQQEARAWLDDHALFAALREEQGVSWDAWPGPLRARAPEALEEARRRLADRIAHHEYLQFEFHRQWAALRRHAGARGVRLVGDLPFYVCHDSADVWAAPWQYRLDPETRLPLVAAGAPPDVFSEEGQRWGNPVYDWSRLAQDGHRWWIERARQALRRFDLIRLDHFRGFEAFWVIPAGAPSAAQGAWERGPGLELFAAMRRELGALPIVVEDLGVITPEVHALREACGFAGMAVVQLAFDGDPDNPHLPHRHAPACAAYTGTHDTMTAAQWARSLDEATRRRFSRYVEPPGEDGAHWELIRLTWGSAARWALAPLQDVLGLDAAGRMNVPGTVGPDNWSWRFSWDQLTEAVRARLLAITRATGRAGSGERDGP